MQRNASGRCSQVTVATLPSHTRFPVQRRRLGDAESLECLMCEPRSMSRILVFAHFPPFLVLSISQPSHYLQLAPHVGVFGLCLVGGLDV